MSVREKMSVTYCETWRVFSTPDHVERQQCNFEFIVLYYTEGEETGGITIYKSVP